MSRGKIPVAQFSYGLTYSGIDEYAESGNIGEYLPSKAINLLIEQGKEITEETRIVKKFKQEQIISVTNIMPVKDVHGRAGTWNHTILVRVEDYIRFTQPENLFQEHFVRDPKDVDAIRSEVLNL